LKLNNISNVNIFLMAVSGKRGTQTLFIPDNESYSGRYSLYPGRGARAIKAKSITLDDVFKENNLHQIDLLKIDCQGAEYEILYSTNAKTLSKIQVIVVKCEAFQEKLGWSLAGLKTSL
jgi:FkbM family methyltransferase